MTPILWVLVGVVLSFVISFGAIVGWWFLLTRGNPQRLARTQDDFEKVRQSILKRWLGWSK